jgi:ABC-type transporter Mla subunit MlaD
MEATLETRLDLIHDDLKDLIKGVALIALYLCERGDQIEALARHVDDIARLPASDRLLASAVERLSANEASLKKAADDLARLLKSAGAFRSAKVAGLGE